MKHEIEKNLEQKLKTLYDEWFINPVSELIPAEIHCIEKQLGVVREERLKQLGISFNGMTGILTYEIKR